MIIVNKWFNKNTEIAYYSVTIVKGSQVIGDYPVIPETSKDQLLKMYDKHKLVITNNVESKEDLKLTTLAR